MIKTADRRQSPIRATDAADFSVSRLREVSGDFEDRAWRGNGVEALAALDSFDPDVITLDINMPEMDGITCLSHIMTRHPRPVVMVSSLTERGAEITLQALQRWVLVDFIHKPDGTMSLDISAKSARRWWPRWRRRA